MAFVKHCLHCFVDELAVALLSFALLCFGLLALLCVLVVVRVNCLLCFALRCFALLGFAVHCLHCFALLCLRVVVRVIRVVKVEARVV